MHTGDGLRRISRRNETAVTLVAIGAIVAMMVFALPSLIWVASTSVTEGTADVSGSGTAVRSLRGTWLRVDGRHIDPDESDLADWQPTLVPEAVAGAGDLTYRITIDGLDPQDEYALYLMEIASAARVWVNGELKATIGNPDRADARGAEFVPQLVLDIRGAAQAEVIIQTSNEVQRHGGLWHPVYFGGEAEIATVRSRRLATEVLVAGAALIALLYHLILFALNPTDRPTLWLALFAIPVALKIMLSGEQILLGALMPDNQIAWIRLAYLALVVAVPLYLRYVCELYPDYVQRSVTDWVTVAAVAAGLLTLFLPFRMVQAAFIGWILVILASIALSAAWAVRAWRDHVPGAFASVLGLIFITVFAVNDILFDRNIIRTGFLLGVGLFGFLLSQAIVVAARFTSMYHELDDLRDTLEQQVRERTDELVAERNRLRDLSRHDDLTGLINRRYGGELLREEVARVLRYGGSLSIILLDLDNFKVVNDSLGHAVGDDVLVGTTRILASAIRATDRIVRWGGEELLIVLPSTSTEDALALAGKLREALAGRPIETRDGPVVVTTSAGVAGEETIRRYATDDELVSDLAITHVADALLRVADNGLYWAKEHGRNQVSHRPDPAT